jgi:hypothetical protein
MMKKSFFWSGILMVVFLAAALVATQATAAGKGMGMKPKASEMKAVKSGGVYVMSGKLEGVYPQWNTAVINCPEGKEMFTVAGSLAPKAELRKDGKPAQLQDFKEGESVTVKWKAVPEGHLILMLSAK